MTARKSLRERLEQARRENYIDLRAGAEAFAGVYVRCRIMSKSELLAAMERDDTNDADTIDVLVLTCIAIWEEADGKGVSPVDGYDGQIDLETGEMTGRFPTFSDVELAEALGLTEGSAEASVRALMAPQGGPRLGIYGSKLYQFSTGAGEDVTRAARGN